MAKVYLFWEPKLVPQMDRDGNIISYTSPIAKVSDLKSSQDTRVKYCCSERGLSADKNDVVGFRKTLETINQAKDTFGFMFQNFGYDDLSVMSRTMESLQVEKINSGK